MSDLVTATRIELLDQVRMLQARVQQLEEEVRFLGNHPTLARGMAGERLALRSTLGSLSSHTSPVDISLVDGRTVEVKTAYLPPQTTGRGRRWAWEKIFGQKNGKTYDFLLLVGESDKSYSLKYKQRNAPFVFFLVPFDEVMPLTTAGVEGARKIQLNTNPNASREAPARALFKRFCVTSDEIVARTAAV